MAGSSLQQPGGADQDQELNHRRSSLKIRRAPSSAIPASYSSSFHGSCSKMMIRKGCTSRASQPLIFHTFDPEVIVTEPAEFMLLVQRLTGSPATRKSVRVSIQKRKEMELSVCPAPVLSILERELSAQQDPLKEGRTIILAPAANAEHASTNNSPVASPTCRGLSKSISHKPHLPSANYEANPLAAPSTAYTKQLNLSANHPPSSSISSNSATCEENYSAYTSPMSGTSPPSPNSSLTASSEGCFSMEEGGASSSCSKVFCYLKEEEEEEGRTPNTEEDGSFNFFVFSRDSYYGNHNYTAAQDELDQFLNFSNANLDPCPPFELFL